MLSVLDMGLDFPIYLENQVVEPLDIDKTFMTIESIFYQPVAVSLGTKGKDEYTGTLLLRLFGKQDEGTKIFAPIISKIHHHYRIGMSHRHEGTFITVSTFFPSSIYKERHRAACDISINWFSRQARN